MNARQTRHREPVCGLRDDRDRLGVRHHERSGVRSQTHGRRHHFADIDLRVVDPRGNALPGWTVKYSCGASPSPPDTGNARPTQEAFTSDGWLRTGDLGNVDDNGFLHITGRIKEIVIRGGENIAPIEIENVAYRHPSVKEVAVFGVPDDPWARNWRWCATPSQVPPSPRTNCVRTCATRCQPSRCRNTLR